jgi:hypothetical protein
MPALSDRVNAAYEVFTINEFYSSRVDVIGTATDFRKPFLTHLTRVSRSHKLCKTVALFMAEFLVALCQFPDFLGCANGLVIAQHCFSCQRFSDVRKAAGINLLKASRPDGGC